MTLVELKLPPGVLYNGTQYQAKGRWRDAQLIRFLGGTIRPVGGWDTLAQWPGVGVSDGISDPPLNVVIQGTDIATDAMTGSSGLLKDHTPTLAPSAGGHAAGWVGTAAYQATLSSNTLIPGSGGTDVNQYARLYVGRQSVCSICADFTYAGAGGPNFVAGIACRMSEVAGNDDTNIDAILLYGTGVDGTHVNMRLAIVTAGALVVQDAPVSVTWTAATAKRIRLDFIGDYVYPYIADATTGYNAAAIGFSSTPYLLTTGFDDASHLYAGLYLKDHASAWVVDNWGETKGPAAGATSFTLIQKPGVTGTLVGTLENHTAMVPFGNSVSNPVGAGAPLTVVDFDATPVMGVPVVTGALPDVDFTGTIVRDLLPNAAVTLTRTAPAITGTVRAMLGWRAEDIAAPLLAIATNSHFYVFSAGVLTDLTPSLTAGGVDTTTSYGNYGSGFYGMQKYGVGDTTTATEIPAGTISLDTFGDYLVAVLAPSDGRVLYWVPGTAAFVAASGSPTGNTAVVVTNERFVMALGAGGDPRALAWASQESLTDWTPDAENSAGDYILPGTGRLMAGRRGRNETLLWTDEDVFSAQYIGGLLIYSITQLGQKCGLIAPMAVAVVDGRAAWMGRRGFWIYDGFVQPAPSEVTDFVFQNFNDTQRAKCFALPLSDYGEVWFFYPSASSTEPDRYVIWNYRENHWTPGRLSRTAGIDRGAFEHPLMASAGTIYEHEFSTDHDGADDPYLESGPIEVASGDRLLHILGLIPDEATQAGQVLGSLNATLYTAPYPTADETTHGPYTLANPTSIRLSGRQVRVRVDEIVPGDWRLGTLRLDGTPGERR